MEKFEVIKVWEDESTQIIFQELTEGEAAGICYNQNRKLEKDTEYFYDHRKQEVNVRLNLRLRTPKK